MPSPGGILALDLSSRTGWAYGGLNERSPIFGCWLLPQVGGEGARYGSFQNELANAMDTLRPSRLVMEAPLTFQALMGVSNMKTMAQQYTLRGIGYAEGWRASIPVSEVSAEMVRSAVLGRGRFPKGEVKQAVIDHCWAQGWRVPDDNAADACLTWAWHTTQIRGGSPLHPKKRKGKP